MGTGTRRTVLIVENEDDVAESLLTVLDGEYDVRRAVSGGEAIAMADERVDVVVLDRQLPDISGDKALDELRSQDIDCRVALLSSAEPDFDIVQRGFDDCLVKPIDPGVIADTVDRLFALDEYEQLYQELSSKRVSKNILHAESDQDKREDSKELRELEACIEDLESRLEAIASEREFDDRLLPS